VPDLDVSFFIDNLMGVRVLDEAWSERGPERRGEPGEYVARLTVPPVLAVGDYVAGLWVGSPYETLIYEEELLRFRLEGVAHGRTNRITQLGLSWDIRPA
jgi:hypothetical protein